MRIGNNFLGMNLSSAGLSMERKRMNLISENIANVNTTKTDEGTPYQRKYLSVKETEVQIQAAKGDNVPKLKMKGTGPSHIDFAKEVKSQMVESDFGLKGTINIDEKIGDIVYMPDHPDADEKGNVKMPNVNIVTEMIDMITASRTYEANVTAIQAGKQIAKDALEI